MAELDTGSDSMSGNDEIVESPAVSPKRKKTNTHVGAARYRSKFKSEWEHIYPVKAVKNDQYSFHCIPCMKNIKCDHQGITDVKAHCKTEAHKKWEKQSKSQPSISGIKRFRYQS